MKRKYEAVLAEVMEAEESDAVRCSEYDVDVISLSTVDNTVEMPDVYSLSWLSKIK